LFLSSFILQPVIHTEKKRGTRGILPTGDSVKKKGKLGAFFWFKRKKGCWTADGRTKRVEKRFAALSFYFLGLSREVQEFSRTGILFCWLV
jgi:hypothetical protein